MDKQTIKEIIFFTGMAIVGYLVFVGICELTLMIGNQL